MKIGFSISGRFLDQVFNISSLVILHDEFVGFAAETGTENALGISIILEQFTLQVFSGR